MIKKSIEFSFKNYPQVSDYVKQYSQTMSEDVMRRHIDLYVNNFSLSLQEEGRTAIETLWSVFQNNYSISAPAQESLFL